MRFEEAAHLFTEENLKKLSMDELVALMQKYQTGFVTHVTGHGVRDHSGMMYHTGGMGEMCDGMKQMLSDGELKSAAAAKGATIIEGICNTVDGLSVRHYDPYKDYQKFFADEIASKTHEEKVEILEEERQDSLENLQSDRLDPRGRAGMGKFPPLYDMCTVHFASEVVLDEFYGGEIGNECFVIYPQAMVVSDFHSDGRLMYEKDPGGDYTGFDPRGYHNDLAVLPNNKESSISLEAGIIFLPANAQVDPSTGSKYETKNGKAVVTGKDENGNDTFEPAKNTIQSQKYWEKFIEKNCQGKNLKIVYYDTNLTPTQALENWMEENGITPNKENQREMQAANDKKLYNQQKKEYTLAYGGKHETVDGVSVFNGERVEGERVFEYENDGYSESANDHVRKRINDMVDFDKLEQYINNHYDREVLGNSVSKNVGWLERIAKIAPALPPTRAKEGTYQIHKKVLEDDTRSM